MNHFCFLIPVTLLLGKCFSKRMEIRNKFSEVNILCSFVLLVLFAHLSLETNPAGWVSAHYVAQAPLSLQAYASMLSLKSLLYHLVLYDPGCLIILSLSVFND